jgi:hypothetical protein
VREEGSIGGVRRRDDGVRRGDEFVRRMPWGAACERMGRICLDWDS